MDLLEMICKELGVEVGDSWAGDAEKQYKINKYGQVRVWNEEYGEWIESYYNLGHVINGDLKPKWKPKEGEKYYYPEIAYNTQYGVSYWKNGTVDNLRLMRGIVFKTAEEAIECATNMIDLAKRGV